MQVTRLYAVESDGYLCKVATLGKYSKYDDILAAAKEHITMQGEPVAFLYTVESDGGGGIIMPFNIPDY